MTGRPPLQYRAELALILEEANVTPINKMKNSDSWEGQGGKAKAEIEKDKKQTVSLLLTECQL